jgi:predicted DNA-binding transcriptional regulator AlpA
MCPVEEIQMARIPVERIALSIPEAAQRVGISRAKFYKTWVGGGLVKTVDLGARGQSVLIKELDAAVERHVQQQRRTG